MRYIIRKYVDAENVSEAINKEPKAPICDVYLKDGEEPKGTDEKKNLIGFWPSTVVAPDDFEEVSREKR
jgi:hypothetical protein